MLLSLTKKDQFLNIFYIVLTHITLALWFVFGYKFFNFSTSVFISIIVCSIHQHFLSEWLHEATHWNLLRNKFYNDIIANILIGIPFGISVNIQRPNHFAHHKVDIFLNHEDIESSNYIIKEKQQLLENILFSLIGVTALNYFFKNMKGSSKSIKFKPGTKSIFLGKNWLKVLLIFHVPFFLFLLINNYAYSYIIYYITLITIYPLFAMMRYWGQHAEVTGKGIASAWDANCSRTNYGGILEFLFFNSPIMKFHNEHHKYPNLPFRSLKKIAKKSNDLNKNGKGCINIAIMVWNGLA